LQKQKNVMKMKDYNIYDLASNDKWIEEESRAHSSLNASNKYILIEVGENKDARRGGVAPSGWFEDSSIADNDMMKVMEKMTLMKMRIMERRMMIIYI